MLSPPTHPQLRHTTTPASAVLLPCHTAHFLVSNTVCYFPAAAVVLPRSPRLSSRLSVLRNTRLALWEMVDAMSRAACGASKATHTTGIGRVIQPETRRVCCDSRHTHLATRPCRSRTRQCLHCTPLPPPSVLFVCPYTPCPSTHTLPLNTPSPTHSLHHHQLLLLIPPHTHAPQSSAASGRRGSAGWPAQ